MKEKTTPLFVLLLFIFSFSSSAQNSFTLVYNLLQTNCAGSGCHNGNTPDIFSVAGSETDVYNALVNKNPSNSTALAKGDKLVSPGYPARSFLLRKIAHGISEPLNLDQPDEAAAMPDTALDNQEIELVRQWILFGAPQTGNVVDTAMINTYYRNGGIEDTYPYHDAPDPGEGFQLYVGKIFLPPHTEREYFIKYNPRITTNIEIKRVQTMLPSSTHHFVIYKFFPGGDNNYSEGLRDVAFDSHADVADGIGTGPNLWNYNLPQGSAYFWTKNSQLDLNLHIRNDDAEIKACDLYINIYTQPIGTASQIMLIRNYPNFDISIPQDNQVHSFSVVANDTTETRMWNIWQLYTHTHRYGVDYDVWKRNADGSKGDQIYEGFCNYENATPSTPCPNMGYYRWGVDVTFRYFEPMLQIDPRLGFIHEASYRNTQGPDPVNWGLTSLDEMMVLGFQFVYGDSLGPLPAVGINQAKESNLQFSSYPNPFNEEVNLAYTVEENAAVKMEIFNMLSEKVEVITDDQKQPGNYFQTVYTNELNPGVYSVRLTVGQQSITRKIIKLE